ncbi:MAG: hypothetical protein HYT22_02735 [Candidatus Niyogibacteria bacterium]|nr:hypothetical protein [Candidatus Niyogibacteria bacterium]
METLPPDREAGHAAQIEALLEIARKKGLEEAVNEARRTNNPHILDDLHDRLATEIRRSLLE